MKIALQSVNEKWNNKDLNGSARSILRGAR